MHSYDRGTLVPFVGSGLSRPACVGWEGLVRNLLREAGQPAHELPEEPTEDELIRCAHRAVRTLRFGSTEKLVTAIGRALAGIAFGQVPPATSALARIPWQIVISTNYDHLFVRSFVDELLADEDRSRDRYIDVCGRSPSDCLRVLNRSGLESRTLLWTIQGFLSHRDLEPRLRELHGDAIAKERIRSWEGLAEEIVVGHAEYRKVANAAPHFRRAFGEMYRTRSLLFLGTGLRDRYLLELFGEITELAGPAPRPHFAIVEKGEVDVRFLETRLNITVIEYDRGRHEVVEEILRELGDMLEADRRRMTRWELKTASEKSVIEASSIALVRGSIPDPSPGDALGVSLGLANKKALVGKRTRRILERWGCDPDGAEKSREHEYLFRFPTKSRAQKGIAVWGIAARVDDPNRSSSKNRHLGIISAACREFLNATASQTGVVHLQLIAAGKRRPFPAPFCVIQMLRAWREWPFPMPPRPATIYLQDPFALAALTSGALDPLETLNCGTARLIVEIEQANAEPERFVRLESLQTTLGELAVKLDVPLEGWLLDLQPPPTPSLRPLELGAKASSTLADLGIESGSALRFLPQP